MTPDRRDQLLTGVLLIGALVGAGAVLNDLLPAFTGPEPGFPTPVTEPRDISIVDTSGAPARGTATAMVTIVEFGNFHCPFCAKVNPTLERIRAHYPDDVRIVFKHFAPDTAPRSWPAHAAAGAAHLRGQFWAMHDAILANQGDPNADRFLDYATEIGLDIAQFEEDLRSHSVRGQIQRDTEEAQRLGVTGTPSFFINGRFLKGARPYEEFEQMIDEELARGPIGKLVRPGSAGRLGLEGMR